MAAELNTLNLSLKTTNPKSGINKDIRTAALSVSNT